mmetsp:Transcript_48863/g.104577  ORF Transcript_48863/g.104577 Transcript_48863/m.104577 type:complete len:217 (+) Transcript_48863:105-755(+)
MSSVKFRDEPKGEITLRLQNTQIFKTKRVQGQIVTQVPKSVFSAEPVRKLGARGHWFELRVDEFFGGEMSLLGIGYTLTDPEAYVEETPLPPRAYNIPRTYMAGYTRSCYWADGERLQADDIWALVKPAKVFTVGALVTPTGSLEIYVNRKLACQIDPTVRGLQPIPAEEPLYAVVDALNGLGKATLVANSLPPTEEEAAAAGGGGGAAEGGEAAA